MADGIHSGSAADIMERKLNAPLRRFAPGKDGGVDLTDDAAKKQLLFK